MHILLTKKCSLLAVYTVDYENQMSKWINNSILVGTFSLVYMDLFDTNVRHCGDRCVSLKWQLSDQNTEGCFWRPGLVPAPMLWGAGCSLLLTLNSSRCIFHTSHFWINEMCMLMTCDLKLLQILPVPQMLLKFNKKVSRNANWKK